MSATDNTRIERKRMKSPVLRRGLTLLAAVCALAFANTGAALAGPDPATTEDPPLAAASCPSGEACLWVHAGLRGQQYNFRYNWPDFRRLSRLAGCTHDGFSDCASSAWNNGRSCTVYMRVHINYRGGYHSLSIGHVVSNFASSTTGYRDPSFNDAVSSLAWCNPNGT